MFTNHLFCADIQVLQMAGFLAGPVIGESPQYCSIYVPMGFGRIRGRGVYLGRGLVLTAAHVISGAAQEVVFEFDNGVILQESIECVVLSTMETSRTPFDVAIVKIGVEDREESKMEFGKLDRAKSITVYGRSIVEGLKVLDDVKLPEEIVTEKEYVVLENSEALGRGDVGSAVMQDGCLVGMVFWKAVDGLFVAPIVGEEIVAIVKILDSILEEELEYDDDDDVFRGWAIHPSGDEEVFKSTSDAFTVMRSRIRSSITPDKVLGLEGPWGPKAEVVMSTEPCFQVDSRYFDRALKLEKCPSPGKLEAGLLLSFAVNSHNPDLSTIGPEDRDEVAEIWKNPLCIRILFSSALQDAIDKDPSAVELQQEWVTAFQLRHFAPTPSITGSTPSNPITVEGGTNTACFDSNFFLAKWVHADVESRNKMLPFFSTIWAHTKKAWSFLQTTTDLTPQNT